MKKSIFFVMIFALIAPLALLAGNPINGLLERIDPGASQKFKIELRPGDQDFFELDQKGDKVVIRGNSYVNIATGLNWYLKYHAGVHLSWNGMSASLPEQLPRVEKPERHTTDLPLRYDLNYCTYSYTMPFWDWERWEQEIDWMALHGVNIPLAAVGQECVWRNVLLRLGYTPEEVNEFIAGPAFLAWWAMNNLEGWGGPNPDSWYERQEDLQKRILRRMAEYGMKPVLPGYSGMVPHNADDKLGLTLDKAGQTWNGYTRPAFLQPTDPRYAEIAQVYYDEQKKLFGTAEYYSMDPFHEMGAPKGVDLGASGRAILEQMKKANPQAVWVVQGWQENPRDEMIEHLANGDILILDLFGECSPMWGIDSKWKREKGYLHHDWVMCLLENFGGNVGLHGRMDQLLDNFYESKSNPMAAHIKGIGFTMEGSENNPAMFELMSELPWRQERVTKEDWIRSYAAARYGKPNASAQRAWEIIAGSIYNCPKWSNQQGTHESIFCCRPGRDNFQASSWSNMKNYYDPASTLAAAEAMLAAADELKGNNNYEYDLVDIVRQAVADQARIAYQHTMADFKAFNKQGFADNSRKFLRLLDLQDSLLATRAEFRVGRWIDYALRAGTTDDEKRLYEWNARTQITTWGNRKCADDGKLRDYAHKEWNGMLRDFYRPRWKAFFASLQAELDGSPASTIDYYAMEEPWTLARNPYPAAAEGDPVETARAVMAEIGDSEQ